jgi:AraC-like DNA-binding protein
MADQPSRLFSFSTDLLPAHERFDMFREEIAHQVARLDVQGADRQSFFARFTYARMGPLNCGAIDVSPASYGRTNDLTADGNDDFVLLVNRADQLHHRRSGLTLRKGGVFLEDNSRTDYITFPAAGALTSVNIPRRTLLELAPSAEDSVGREIDEGGPAMRLLTSYVSTLIESETADADLLDLAGQHVLELAAIALNGNGRIVPGDRRSGVKAARLSRVRRCIDANLANPALSLALVAALNTISERYVQLLFEEEGTNFTEVVLEKRLRLAFRLLASPLYRFRRISDIAYGAGFVDLTHFNRSFRRRFGCTPSDVRRRDDAADPGRAH